MTDIKRLQVIYKVNDKQYVDGMQRMKRAGLEANAAIKGATQETERANDSAAASSNRAATEIANSNKRVSDSATAASTVVKRMTQDIIDSAIRTSAANKSASDSWKAMEVEMTRLQAKYDPLAAAARRYEQAVEEVKRAHRLGVLDAAKYEAAMTTLNREFTRGGKAMGAGRFQMQNASYQIADFAVQVGAGSNAMMAASQQIPQLLGGFGALGAILGGVVAVAGAAYMVFGDVKGASETLKESVEDLKDKLQDYKDAVEVANTPTGELIEKYGKAAVAAQQLAKGLADIAKIEAINAVNAATKDLGDLFEGVVDKVERYNELLATGQQDETPGLRAVRKLQDEYSLTIEQAQQLTDLLNDQQSSQGLHEQADAALAVAEFLKNAAESANYQNDKLNEGSKLASQMAMEALNLKNMLDLAAGSANQVAISSDFIGPRLNAAAAAAANLSAQLRTAVALAQSLGPSWATPGAPSPVNPFRPLGGEDMTTRFGGMSLAEQFDFKGEWGKKMALLDNPPKGGGGGGGKGKKGREEKPFFENIEKENKDLERQIELIGKSGHEVAEAEARWKMLDLAKSRGIKVDDELNEKIDAQAKKFADLTMSLEAGEAAFEAFEDGIDDVASAFTDVLVEGESFRKSFANLLKDIASDLVNSGIRNLLTETFKFGGGGDGGGFWKWASGALSSVKLPSFEGGGDTGFGVRAGGIDNKGGRLAVVHPNETITDHTKGGGAGAANFNIDVRGAQGNREIEESISRGVQAGLRMYDQGLPDRVQQINSQPRRR